MQIEHEIVHRIHIGEYAIEVGTNPDNPEYAHLRTVGRDNQDYFGIIDLALEPQAALALGNALVSKAIELGAKQK